MVSNDKKTKPKFNDGHMIVAVADTIGMFIIGFVLGYAIFYIIAIIVGGI